MYALHSLVPSIDQNDKFASRSSMPSLLLCQMETPKLLCAYVSPVPLGHSLDTINFDWAGLPCVAPLKWNLCYIVHLLTFWWGVVLFSCENWVGN